MHLCPVCAAKKGMGLGLETGAFNISDIIGNMSGYFKDFLPPEKKTLRCRSCGLKYSEFKETGRLGCPECYKAFAEGLEGLLKTMHKGTRHAGKVPEALRETREQADRLKSLQKKLDKAIKEEDFEQAAHLRDEIKQITPRGTGLTVT